jgi:hypothetical protein
MVAWVYPDWYDNRPEMSWSYVLAALRGSGVAVPGTAGGPGRMGDHGFLLRLAAALAAQDPPVTLESLTRWTEGWAAGLRLAAISLSPHPDPDKFVKELAPEDSTLTGCLVDEVLNAQPRPACDVPLCTSVMEHISADTAAVLAGDERARIRRNDRRTEPWEAR